MNPIPAYFEQIRKNAAHRWEQLEQDPDLAGPWHLLFNQVQSPRHVLSELLQNADDAGATEASVNIKDNEFIFSHNGEDFIGEHFASLCRFGYSNKRSLHTIGFRGIGFKCTFSLGDEVCLFTPSLSVAFRSNRFTEPVWIEGNGFFSNHTEVRVIIKDEHRQRELDKNLKEWLKSPASLLFFKSIRCLKVGEQEVRWISDSPGPVADSEWVSLSTSPEDKYLLLRSSSAQFPDDALEEIRQERMVSVDDEMSFPPCRIEIVLGQNGRLFVVLPTEVKTALPFACNAPFIQDPARIKIKDPETSPTNRWLLKRIGELAAKGMLLWLQREDLEIEDRCRAYALLPDVDRNNNSLEGCCATTVEEAFEGIIDGAKFLLTEEGTLEEKEKCIFLPNIILDIWSPVQVKKLFDKEMRPILSRHIIDEDKKKLHNWGVDALDKPHILNTLESSHLPKPETWRQLLTLWSYVSKDITVHHYYQKHDKVRIIPVQGKDVLYASAEVVRLGEKKLLQSQQDWEFLSEHLLVLNSNWLRYLDKQRRETEHLEEDELGEQVEAAYANLKALNLEDSSDVSIVIEQVAKKMFAQGNQGDNPITIKDCIQLAQIAAKLGASARDSFRFVTRDRYLRDTSQKILADIKSNLDQFIEDEWYNQHVLHDDYFRDYISCTSDDFRQWILSGRSELLTFVPLIEIKNQIYGRDKLFPILRERGLKSNPYFPFVTNEFIIKDLDFEPERWQHWKILAEKNVEFWGHLFKQIITQPKGFWSKALSAKVLQVATTGTERSITSEELLPSWIMKFRALPCLQDTHGRYREPAELLLRTPETEALLEVESFVRTEYDTEHTKTLLIKLGVRDTPTGSDRLLERLRALATVENPPVYEIGKWYHRLDKIIDKCSTEERQKIKGTFAGEKIILTEKSTWVRAAEVFLHPDETYLPDAEIVHPSVRHLALWHKIDVAERPTAELALKWLDGLPLGQKLSPSDLRRVRALLPLNAGHIWNECGYWLNLEGEWVETENLEYKLSMQSLFPWGNLFRPIKQKTADFQSLSAEICRQYPFSELTNLASIIEDRFLHNSHNINPSEIKPWLNALGEGLIRLQLDNEEEASRVWKHAERLIKIKWQTVPELKIIPYINGTPAGTARNIDVLWKDNILYVQDRPVLQILKPIAQELARPFDRQDITEAIEFCIERFPEFVTAYLEENFQMMPIDEAQPIKKGDTIQDTGFEKIPEHQPGREIPPEIPASAGVRTNGIENEDISSNGESQEENTDSITRPIMRPSPSLSKPLLMERYALSNGYTKDASNDRFYKADGSWIQKISGNSFPWERYSSSGTLLQCYWPKEHCIHREPLQLDAEIWELCDKNPDKYTLLLTDIKDNPIELSGYRLRELCDSGRLTLFPAKYRLVYDYHENNCR